MTTLPENSMTNRGNAISPSSAQSVAIVLARVLLALIFVLSGVSKIGALDGTLAYMQALGVPGALLWPTIVFEIGSGLLVMVGFQTRLTAFLMAVFCLLTGAIFHHAFADQIQLIMLLKNVSMAGGFLLLAAVGPGPISLDRKA